MINILPMVLWVEASMTTIYGRNMSPHQILKNMTPEEAFTRVKPKVGHFRIFGCPSISSCTQRKEIQARPLKKKGHICGIQ
jgi:hypothetical protein